jgi:hypothetical protein
MSAQRWIFQAMQEERGDGSQNQGKEKNRQPGRRY